MAWRSPSYNYITAPLDILLLLAPVGQKAVMSPTVGRDASQPKQSSCHKRAILAIFFASIFIGIAFVALSHTDRWKGFIAALGEGVKNDLAAEDFSFGPPRRINENDAAAGGDGVGKGRDSSLPSSAAVTSGKHDSSDVAKGAKVDGNADTGVDLDTDTVTTPPHRRRMNVVLLYPDDWRHDMLQDERPGLRTPFLTSLAKEGIRFTKNCVTASLCWVSRATLFSGQYASRHGSVRLRCPHFSKPERWAHSWPRVLQREAGYFVGHVGKWQFWEVWDKTKNMFDWKSTFEGRHFVKVWDKNGVGRHVHASDRAADEAIRFLRERPGDRPFALTVAFYPPKPVGADREPGGQWMPTNQSYAIYANATIPEPIETSENSFHLLPQFLQKDAWVPRARWIQRYRTPEHYQEAMRRIYALITDVDKAMENIVNEIKKQDLYNNTMIVVTADNGMFHSSHGLAGKWYPYQESIRVPLIIYDPRMPDEKRGTISDSYTLNIDLASTILGAAGLKNDAWMQGRDISDLYLRRDEKRKTNPERRPWREDFFYEMPDIDAFIPPSTALVHKKWKYIHWFKHGKEQLFDLDDDPLEMKDRINDPMVAGVLSSLRQRHDELRSSIRAPNVEGVEQLNCTK